MEKILTLLLLTAFAVITPIAAEPCASCLVPTDRQVLDDPGFERLESHNIARANRAHWLNDDYYITYQWDKRPRIGHHVLIVKLYNKDKQQVQELSITADAYMPSMKGAHDTGDVAMRLNNRGDYLVPVHFMMLGDWEIELKFSRDDKELTRAYVQLDLK